MLQAPNSVRMMEFIAAFRADFAKWNGSDIASISTAFLAANELAASLARTPRNAALSDVKRYAGVGVRVQVAWDVC